MRKEYDFSKGRRGAVVPQPGKTRITIYLDDQVLEAFRERADAALRLSAAVSQLKRGYRPRTQRRPRSTSRMACPRTRPATSSTSTLAGDVK